MVEETRTEFLRAPEPSAESRVWYVANPDGEHQGPFNWNELQARVQHRELEANTHVWREGLKEWQRIGEVLDVDGGTRSAPAASLSSLPPSKHGAEPEGRIDLTTRVTHPTSLRYVARGAAASGALLLMASLAGALFGWSWFNGALLLLVAFPILEALAELLERTAARPDTRPAA